MMQLGWKHCVVGWPLGPGCSNLGSQWAWSPVEWELIDEGTGPRSEVRGWFCPDYSPSEAPKIQEVITAIFSPVWALLRTIDTCFLQKGKESRKGSHSTLRHRVASPQLS